MSKPSKAINPRTKLNLANQQLRPRGGHRRYDERKTPRTMRTLQGHRPVAWRWVPWVPRQRLSA